VFLQHPSEAQAWKRGPSGQDKSKLETIPPLKYSGQTILRLGVYWLVWAAFAWAFIGSWLSVLNTFGGRHAFAWAFIGCVGSTLKRRLSKFQILPALRWQGTLRLGVYCCPGWPNRPVESQAGHHYTLSGWDSLRLGVYCCPLLVVPIAQLAGSWYPSLLGSDRAGIVKPVPGVLA